MHIMLYNVSQNVVHHAHDVVCWSTISKWLILYIISLFTLISLYVDHISFKARFSLCSYLGGLPVLILIYMIKLLSWKLILFW